MTLKITTVDEAFLLVGRTFSRDGKSRTITRVDNFRRTSMGGLSGDVYWKRPGGNEQKRPMWLPYFIDWLSKAEDVTSDTTGNC